MLYQIRIHKTVFNMLLHTFFFLSRWDKSLVFWRCNRLKSVWCIFQRRYLGIGAPTFFSLEQHHPPPTVTASRQPWRKRLSLCASHFPINQPATGLSSGCFSQTPPQGGSGEAFRLSKQNPSLLLFCIFTLHYFPFTFLRFAFFFLLCFSFLLDLHSFSVCLLHFFITFCVCYSPSRSVFPSVLEKEVRRNINIIIRSSEGLQGIGSGKAHFH